MTSRILRFIGYVFALLGLMAAVVGRLIIEREEEEDNRPEEAGENR